MIAGVYKVKISGLGFFPKFGTLSLRTVDSRLSGSLTLFGKELKLNYGTYLGDKLELEGEIPLKLGTIGFTGKGTVKDDTITLELDTDRGKIYITGKKKSI